MCTTENMENLNKKYAAFQLLITIVFLEVSTLVNGASPVINSFDKVAVLYEGTTVNEVLSTIDCTDPDGDLTNTYVSTISSPSACSNCFEVLDCSPSECLEYRAGVGTLNYVSAQSFQVTVSCDDNIDPPATEVIDIIIKPNSPPYFDPDPDVLYINQPIDAGAGGVGTLIYNADAIDDELDVISYSLSVSPSSSSSNYEIDPATGEITSTVDLKSICRTADTLSVTISDGTNTVGPRVITVAYTNANTAPVGINLDTTVQIPEDETGNAYEMIFQDSENDKLTYTITSSNPAGEQQFSITSNKIDVATALDYETSSLRQTDLVVTASDGYCSSPSYRLRLQVTDVNEEPTIGPEDSTIEVCEGQSEFDPGYSVTDPDTVDTVTWSLDQSPSTNFSINPTTGALMTLLDYDVDTQARPVSEKFVVRATDKGGLYATATVTVTFLDCNDNAPVMEFGAYEEATSECTGAGTVVGTIKATDEDSDREQNNVLYYTGSGGSVSVGTGGEIIVNQPMPAGTVVTFSAYAWDRGQTPGPLRSENPAVVSVRFTPCPTTPPPVTAAPTTAAVTTTTTTTTTTAASGTFTREDDDPNLPWIIIAALLGTFFLGLLSFMLWRYGSLCLKACNGIDCGKACKARPRPAIEPYREYPRRPIQKEPRPPSTPPEPEEKKPPGPGFLFGFWKERYPDDDIQDQPNRANLPTPGDMNEHYPHTIDLADDAPAPVEPSADAPAKTKNCIVM